jgi:glycosyltransferase involved in cell wall biosynthesis
MKRIAFFGPLPPSTTGIADYDEALLPLLRKDFEVDVFLQQPFPNREGFSHADFFSKHFQNPYDLTLYQMGNSLFHEYMYGYLFQNPGVVIFHDYCLLHSRSEMLLEKGFFLEYRDELAAVYPEQAEQIADTIISSAAGDLLFYQFPFFDLVLRSSLAAAAHTDFAVKKLSTSQTPVIKIPHLELPGATPIQDDPAAGKFVIATFGYVTGAKRISTLLEATAEIGRQYPDVLTVIAGDVEDRAALNQQVESLGIGGQVMVTERLPITEFLQWMGRADVIVNLRYPSAGEMSGTLVRALSSSKPVIISRLAGLQEIPEDAVLRVRPDREKSDLKKALLALI